jgi:hypothetical protein
MLNQTAAVLASAAVSCAMDATDCRRALRMSSDSIEYDAREMIREYGSAAARIARVRAEIAENYVRNQRLVLCHLSIVG